MKILLTGTTGYTGKRLLPVLLYEGHEVICCTRDKKRFNAAIYNSIRMKGLYSVLPFHAIIFRGMIRNIAKLNY